MASLLVFAVRLLLAQGSPVVDDALPLRLTVGEVLAICETGTVICPAAVRCDDTSIVQIGADGRGALLTAVKPGSTVCSAGSASGLGMRRVYRLTVVEKPSR
jgi:hypothetical protein